MMRALLACLAGVFTLAPLCLAQTAGRPAPLGSAPSVAAETPPAASLSNLSSLAGRFPILPPAPTAGNNVSSQPQGQVSSFIGTASRSRRAPRRDDRTAISTGSEHLNLIFGGFEHGAGLGLGLELTTASKIPGIELRGAALISTRNYRQFEVGAFIPKLGDKETHAEVWINYTRRRKDNFFGIGPRSSEADETNYTLEERSFNAVLARDFTARWQSGIYLRVADTDTYRGFDATDPPIDVIFSASPTIPDITRWVPGLRTGSKILSYGLYAEYDRRNDARGLTRGFYFYGRLASSDGLEKSAFSDYGWIEGEIDARGYIPLGGDRTSLALRVLTELKGPKGGSQIPFYDLARLGGRSYLRGFHSFRFHANNLLLLSTELRQTLFKQGESGGADVIIFGDAGQAWGDNRSKTNPAVRQNNRFDASHWRAALGGGFQYRFSKQFGARIEVGHSNEGNRVYFTISRGF